MPSFMSTVTTRLARRILRGIVSNLGFEVTLPALLYGLSVHPRGASPKLSWTSTVSHLQRTEPLLDCSSSIIETLGSGHEARPGWRS